MKTTRQYGEKQASALSMWVKLARAFSTFNKVTVEHIRSFGLTQAQFGALECLGHLGSMTIGELCKKQLVSGGNMTVIVDNLEKDGLVQRIRSVEDRRVIVVQLTPAGKKRFLEIFPRHAECVAKAASVLSPGEMNELSRLLKKLGVALSRAD